MPWCLAQEKKAFPRIDFSGYISNIQNLTIGPKLDSPLTSILLHNRFNIKITLSNRSSVRIGIRNRIFMGDQPGSVPNFPQFLELADQLFPLFITWLDGERIVGHSALDRAYFQYSLSKMDLRIGMQRINWGVVNFWNPNDIFNAYNFLDFDYVERFGVEAIRIQYYRKINSSIELAWKPGNNNDTHIGGLLYKFNKFKYDFQALAGLFNKDYVAGAGWAGGIKKLGFKGELTYFMPWKSSPDTFNKLVASLMIDNVFKNGWYFSTSVLLNLSKEPEGILRFGPVFANLTARTLSPYKYNFYLGASKSFTPIFTGNFYVLYSPAFYTTLLYPNLGLSVSKNIDLNLIAQVYFSSPASTYKMQGATLFFRLKWGFGSGGSAGGGGY